MYELNSSATVRGGLLVVPKVSLRVAEWVMWPLGVARNKRMQRQLYRILIGQGSVS